MMSVADTIKAKLTEAFDPVELEVVDDSASHQGHAGWDPRGETHFNVKMVSSVFKDLNRVACQRLVHETLSDELAGPVHALSLNLKAPSSPAEE